MLSVIYGRVYYLLFLSSLIETSEQNENLFSNTHCPVLLAYILVFVAAVLAAAVLVLVPETAKSVFGEFLESSASDIGIYLPVPE